jgi:UPF0755 protein
MKKVLIALAGIVLVGGIGVGGAFFWAERGVDAPGPAGEPQEVVFVVPKGTPAREVGRLLEQENLIASRALWRFHLWRRGGLQVKAGRFALKHGMSLREVATALETSPLAEDQPFVVVEGWRLRDTDSALAAKGLIRPGAYVAAASEPKKFNAPFPLPTRSLEGYLYPETYRIPKEHVEVRVLIQRQLDMFVERIFKPHQAEIAQSKRSLHDLVTLASMLEREEPVPEQRPLVAGILWKRLDRHIPLGVDATSRYELAEWNDRQGFLQRLRDESDPYNSRSRVGLPPTPIGSPTESSFQAALRPEKSDYLYYLHDGNRKLHPSRNAAEHEALRAQYGIY